MSDILEKPVHAILLKPDHIQSLVEEGRLPQALKERELPLPKPKKEKKNKLNLKVLNEAKKWNVPSGNKLRKQQRTQMRLRALHDSIPGPDPVPPCSTCKTAPCCKAFVVVLTELEYDSGLYGDMAIKFTPDVIEQINHGSLLPLFPNDLLPNDFHGNSNNSYYLEGMMGQPCPFLQEDNRCGIYENRPITCRVYSCVGDPRITEGMRQGTEPLMTLRDLLEGLSSE